MTFEQILTLLALAGTGAGALLGYAKVIAPAVLKLREKEAEEQAKQREHEREIQRAQEAEAHRQREHEREMSEARAAAEQSEEVARWEQMVQLQNAQSATLNTLLDFIINLATDRLEKQDESRSTYHTTTMVQLEKNKSDLVVSLEKIRHELRELHTSLSVLVNEAVRQEDYRAKIGAIPDHLLEAQRMQIELYERVTGILVKYDPISDG